MALIWLYSRQVPLAILPFTVYSIFHVATYTRTNLIPTIQPPPAGSASPAGKPSSTSGAPGASGKSASPLADTIGRFVKQYYDASMSLVAGLEIALWFRVLISAFTFSRGSWTLLLVYTIFFRSRYSQSAFVQGAFHGAARRVDALVANQSTPPQACQAWIAVKNAVAKATEMTDLRKYTGAQVGKKAQ